MVPLNPNELSRAAPLASPHRGSTSAGMRNDPDDAIDARCARREVLQLCAPKTVRCAKSYALHNLLPRFNIHAFCSSRLMVF